MTMLLHPLIVFPLPLGFSLGFAYFRDVTMKEAQGKEAREREKTRP